MGSECSYPFRQYWAYFKGYWFIRTITVIIIIVVVLAILVQNTKDTNNFAKWAFTFLSDWALVLSASATLLLALVAFWAIMDNRNSRILDKKERLLNEIIEWAEDVLVCALSIPASMIIEDITYGLEMAAVEKMVQRANVTKYTNVRLRYQISARKRKYIEVIASGLSRDLGSAVKNLSKQIDDIIGELRKCAKDTEDKSKYENLLRVEGLLHEQADILIEKAVNIKSRDIP